MGVVSGMNEKGLTVTINAPPNADPQYDAAGFGRVTGTGSTFTATFSQGETVSSGQLGIGASDTDTGDTLTLTATRTSGTSHSAASLRGGAPLWSGSGHRMRTRRWRGAVTVASVLPQAPASDGAEALRDIKSQASLPLPTDWLAIAAGALGLALVVGAGWWLFRWVGRRGRLDNRSPEEVALDQLGRIRALDYPAQGNFKAHYSLVTDCLREYLERQYDIPARDQTTRELKRALETTRMSGIYVQQFTDLFADSDLVKFAKFTPTVDAARDLLIQAEKLVRETADEVARQAEADRLAEKAQASNPAVPAANGA
jgi:hypothetical protein